MNGEVYCQANAIDYYLAKKFGFLGDSELDQLKIDMVKETAEGWVFYSLAWFDNKSIFFVKFYPVEKTNDFSSN